VNRRFQWVSVLIFVALSAFKILDLFPYSFEPWIDAGRDLLVPFARVHWGLRLYVDQFYTFGPVTPLLCSGWIRFWGGFESLLALNIGLYFLACWLLWATLREVFDETLAWVGPLSLLTVFSWNQLLPIRTYQFLQPYSEALLFGLIVFLWALRMGVRLPARPWVIGALWALSFWIKFEIFVSMSGLLLLLVGLAAERRRVLLWFGIGAVAGVCGSMAFLSIFALDRAEAVAMLRAPWQELDVAVSGRAMSLPFYQISFGLMQFVQWPIWGWVAGATALVTGALVLLDRRRALPWVRLWVCLGLGFAFGSNRFGSHWAAPWVSSLLAYRAFRQGRAAETLVLAAGVVFASKILFNFRVLNYGFILGIPAFVGILAVIGHSVSSVSGFRWAYVGVVFGILGGLCQWATWQDRKLPDELGRTGFAEALRLVETQVPAGSSLAVWPEGEWVNLASLRKPWRFSRVLPLELEMLGGESALISSLALEGPDFILIRANNLAEYGSRELGVDFVPSLRKVILESYERVGVFGKVPLDPARIGSGGILFKRKSGSG